MRPFFVCVGSFAIAPWNAPLTLAMRAIGFPLMCGNAVVLKTSELSPRTQAIAIEAFAEVRLVSALSPSSSK